MRLGRSCSTSGRVAERGNEQKILSVSLKKRDIFRDLSVEYNMYVGLETYNSDAIVNTVMKFRVQ